MAGRGWTRSIFLAMLGAAGTAAAQLGLGYGLAIVAWVPPDGSDPAATGAWSSSLGWSTFVGATSVVIGAVLADRSRGNAQSGPVLRFAWCLVLSFAAAIGALLAVPLVAVPASRAAIADNYAPHLLATVYAVLGVVLGLLIALIALGSRAVAANVMTTTGWLWALAVIAVSGGVAAGRLDYAPLGVWKFTNTGPIWHGYYVPGVLVLLGGALLAGGLGAYPSAARGEGRLGVALSGAFGPLLVVAAYELASPQADNARSEQVSALHIAPYMVLAGLLGSVLVAAVGGIGTGPRRGARRSAHRVRSNAAGPIAAPTSPGPAPMVSAPAWNPPGSARPAGPRNAATGTASVPASARIDPYA